MKRSLQMSESVEMAIFLALSGGLMDAYSYLLRGEVFANAQTGNMLLMGVYASKGNWLMTKRYFYAISSFAIGIAIAQVIRKQKSIKLHWRQISIFIEIILLVLVAFIPERMNQLANNLTSLACGIQVQSFRKINGNLFSTTMCIGNLRSATHEMIEFIYSKNKNNLESGAMYFFIIFCFILGAVIGSIASEFLHLKTILISPFFLSISFFIMFIDREAK